MSVPPLTWLYVPADRPDRVEKAIASRAHAVIVDLEDGVPAGREGAARANGLPALLGERREKPVFVRVNAGSDADLEAVAQLAIDGVFVPKVERAEDVPAGVRGARADRDGARARVGVRDRVAPGCAGDLARRGATSARRPARSRRGSTGRASRVVNAAVAAGLPRPPQSVYPHVRDLEGLAASCRRGRELGHLGRAAIHPDQLPVIEQAYLPTAAEVETARETIERLEEVAVGTLADGAFVDPAMLGGARQVVALAERYGTA